MSLKLKAASFEHYHRCRCGTVWKHDYETALWHPGSHTCPGCGSRGDECFAHASVTAAEKKMAIEHPKRTGALT